MSTATTEVTTSYETELWLVEVTVDLNVWCDDNERSPDGYEVTSVFVSFYTDDTYETFNEWTSKSPAEAEAALTWLELGQTTEFNKGLEKLMEADHDASASDLDADNYSEPDFDCVADERRDEAREWGGMDGY
jgi:hypothetical protein